MATEEHFKQIRGTSDSVRVIMTKNDQHEIISYAVQFEVAHEGRFYPAVRFDAAHGHPHRDTLDWDGRVIDKHWRRPLPLAIALAEAEADVRINWRLYREEFLRRKP